MNKFLIIISTLLFLAFSDPSFGQKSEETTTIGGEKYYLHTVKEEQTLYRISQIYKVDLATLRSVNNLETNNIKPGQTLKVPVTGGQTDQATFGDHRLHEVKRKETLYGIAKKYKVEVEEIIRLNPSVKEGLQTGQELKIPRKKSVREGETVHEVKQGETLFSLSQQYNVKIARIREINPEIEKEGLKIGQQLKIPDPKEGKDGSPSGKSRSHKVKKGETLFSIAKEYEVKPEMIKGANPGLKPGEMEPGQIIKIPKAGKIEFFSDKSPKAKEGFHIVKKGETLFSLSRKYGISVDSLLSLNPTAKEGLFIGQSLRINARKERTDTSKRSTQTYPDTSQRDSLIFHVVKKGETLDSLATYYGVDKGLIVLLNQTLWFRDLEEGDMITIPVFSSQVVFGGKGKKDLYQIAVFLPLNLDKNDSILENTPAGKDKQLYPSTKIALEFYQGLRLALDSVKEKGLSVKLHVFETKRDSSYMAKLLQKEKMDQMDLFIGPFFSSNLKVTAHFAKRYGIHTVTPVLQGNRILLGNPRISKVAPSRVTRAQQLAKYLARKHSTHNVILMDNESVRDRKYLKVFEASFNKHLPLQEKTYQDSIKSATMEEFTLKELKSKLEKDTLNILAVPVQDNVFASDLMTRLSNLKEDYKIQIYGLEDWLDFESIDISYKHQFNLHVASSKHIDYDGVETLRFIKAHRKEFHIDPSSYTFLGHDIGTYYFTGLLQFGLDFPLNFDRILAKPLHMDFDFYKTGVESGYENKHLYILRYKDFDLKRVKKKHVH